MSPKALIIANDFTTIHHFRMELLERLQEEGWFVVVALPSDDRNGEIADCCAKLVSIPLSRFSTNPLIDMRTFLSLVRLIRKEKPEVVLTYTAKPNIYGGLACMVTSTPYICTITGLGANYDKNNLVSRVMTFLQRIAFSKASRVFFQNEGNKKALSDRGIARNCGMVIPGSGVNLDENRLEPYPHNDMMRFLAVARIRKDKGYDELFDAFERIVGEGLRAELHVVGWYEDDAYRERVERLQQTGCVTFFDYVPHDQMHMHFAACDCLVHPSWHEGMSNTILEACATGRPCIVSNIHGCKEAVIDGETGYLFHVKDADDLYLKMRLLMDTDMASRKQMGISGRLLMEKKFDRALVVQIYLDEMNRIRSNNA